MVPARWTETQEEAGASYPGDGRGVQRKVERDQRPAHQTSRWGQSQEEAEGKNVLCVNNDAKEHLKSGIFLSFSDAEEDGAGKEEGWSSRQHCGHLREGKDGSAEEVPTQIQSPRNLRAALYCCSHNFVLFLVSTRKQA